MAFALALTLPGLVVGLTLLVLVDRLAGRRWGRGRASAAGLDVFGTALAPARRHAVDERNCLELVRDEDGDAAPPRTRVDLDRATATVHLSRG